MRFTSLAIAALGIVRISALNAEVTDVVKDKHAKTVYAADVAEYMAVAARHLRNAYLYSGAEEQKSLADMERMQKEQVAAIDTADLAGLSTDTVSVLGAATSIAALSTSTVPSSSTRVGTRISGLIARSRSARAATRVERVA